MSTQPDGDTVRALSEDQIQALGGPAELFTWLRWLREKREFVAPLLKGFEEFAAATTWRGRLAAVGGLMDGIGAIIETAPTEISHGILSELEGADQAVFMAEMLTAYQAEFEALKINWGGLLEKLPQVIGYVQLVAELLKRFKAPAGMLSAAVVIPPVHGLVYRPFATAA